jgi:hypothetical protein
MDACLVAPPAGVAGVHGFGVINGANLGFLLANWGQCPQ